MLDSFASVTDMSNRSQGAITATSHPFLAQELRAATRSIRNACGWHIARAETIVRRSRSRSIRDIWVPAMEIQSVTITPDNGVDHVLTDQEFDPDTGWTSWAGFGYSLSFVAGFEQVPEDLVGLTCEIAAVALGSPLNLKSYAAGSVSVTLDRVGGGIDPATTSRLAQYRLGRLP